MNKLMEPAGYPEFNTDFQPAWKIFHTNANPQDVCTWHGIECTSGLMQSLWLDIRSAECKIQTIIRLDWLPPHTLTCSLNLVWVLNGWNFRSLPKSILFIALRRCEEAAYANVKTNLDFRQLPPQLEEMHFIESYFPMQPTICIQNLPKTLRILHISCISVSVALVDFASLPRDFQSMCLGSPKNKSSVKIESIRGKGKDNRVINKEFRGDMRRLMQYSEYIPG